MEDAIIKVDHVSMRFNLAREKVDSLKAVSYTHLTLPTT